MGMVLGIGAIPEGGGTGGMVPPNLKGWGIITYPPQKLSAPHRNVVPPPPIINAELRHWCCGAVGVGLLSG